MSGEFVGGKAVAMGAWLIVSEFPERAETDCATLLLLLLLLLVLSLSLLLLLIMLLKV